MVFDSVAVILITTLGYRHENLKRERKVIVWCSRDRDDRWQSGTRVVGTPRSCACHFLHQDLECMFLAAYSLFASSGLAHWP